MSERILSVLVEDKPGVLARISSTISRRGFNINSLSVGPTNIEGRSKMTIVTELESVEQVKKQLNKLINVIKIVELDPDNTIESEVLLMKVSINKDSQTSVIEKGEPTELMDKSCSAPIVIISASGNWTRSSSTKSASYSFAGYSLLRRT